MSTPQSKICICSGVRLNSDYIHSIYFPTKAKQSEYFDGKVDYTFSSYTYLRKSWDIKIEATMEQARLWNYLFFTNNGKRWYYFINNIEYVNDTTVKLTVEIDVIQSYLFDSDTHLSECFIERQHVKDDTIGSNLIDENLELGEFITDSQDQITLDELCVLVMSTINPDRTTEETTYGRLGDNYHGVYSGVGVYAVPKERYSEWSVKLNKLDNWGKSEAIISMWMYPKELVKLREGYTWTDDSVCKEVQSVETLEEITTQPDLVGDYNPDNNKLHTYPYKFMVASNNMGGSAVYKYEFFTDSENPAFHIRGAISPDAKVFMFPRYYKGIANNYDEGLTLSGYPTCAWNQDVYKLWLAQNQNQQNLALTTGVLKISAGAGITTASLVSGGAIGGVAGVSMMAGGVMDIQNILAQRKDKEIQPPQSKGDHSVSVNVAMGCHTFIIKHQCITKEYAKMIDDYFNLYGYAIKRVQTPEICTRENWTYIKTIGCHVYGKFCNDDKKKIERIFDNGITFWVNGDSIGNYYLSNKPKS